MTVVENGQIRQLSVSQIESFDTTQTGGCNRRWWFERAMDLRADQTSSQTEGEALHAHLAHYLTTGEIPKGRKLMGKAATAAIVKGDLPALGEDLFVELRFDGQPKTDAEGNWIPLDVANTLTLAGVPLEGFIDLAFRRGPIPEIWDHKSFNPCRPEISEDPHFWLKKPSELIKTVQMPVYVASQIPYWPDAERWRIVHHNVSRKGVDSVIRAAVVTTAEVRARIAEIESTIERMKVVARAERQDGVPANLRACDAWTGCPHQSICSAFKKGKPPVTLSPEEEAAIFGDLPESEEPVSDSAPTPPVPPPAAAAAPAPAKVRRMPMIDVPAPGAAVEPLATEPLPACACGVTITAENGSRLQSGSWVHVNCPLKAPPPPPAKERKPRAPKVAPPPPPVPVVEFPKPAPVGVTVEPGTITATPAPAVPNVVSAPPAEPVTLMGALGTTVGPRAAVAFAEFLESFAKLLRAVA